MLYRYPLQFFFLLSYAISWSFWLPLLLAKQSIIPYQPPQYLHLVGSLGPALAALIMTRVCSGSVGLRDLLRRIFEWRVALRWHVIAWLSPFLLFFLAVLFTGWNSWEPQSFGRSAEYPELPSLLYGVVSILFYGWGEETGWRGFALPHLQTHQSALKATVILSLGWALWHLPLFGFTPGFSRMGVAEVLGWYFSILTGAIILTWLTNSTRGSILIAAIFHGTIDIVFVSPASPSIDNALGALITVWGIAVLVIARPQYLSGKGKVVVGQEEDAYKVIVQGQRT
jgi:membrane protease YdiL (CAAX protease family)